MAWMSPADYKPHSRKSHFRWKIKWRLELLSAIGVMGERARFSSLTEDVPRCPYVVMRRDCNIKVVFMTRFKSLVTFPLIIVIIINRAGRHRVLKWAPFVFRTFFFRGGDRLPVLCWLVRGLMTRSKFFEVFEVFSRTHLMVDSIVGLVCFQ